MKKTKFTQNNQANKVKKERRERLTPEEYLAKIRGEGKNVVGTFINGNKGSFIIPDDDRMPQSVNVRSINDNGQAVIEATVSGKKVVGKFTAPDSAMVDVIEVLEKTHNIPVDVLGILRHYDLNLKFPDEVIDEARKAAKMTPADYVGREDLRDQTIITIDPADAKDLDDAVSLKQNKDGTLELGVHIADVSHYVKRGTALYEEAYKRGTSVYFPGGVIPMLPTQLSNNICSLLPNVDRLTLSCFMTIDREGNVVDSRIAESVINVDTRFAYEEVQKILDGDPEERKKHQKLIPMIEAMSKLTDIIEAKRRERGEVVFDVPEPHIVLDADGKIASVSAHIQHKANRIIETAMIMANEEVAGYAFDHGLPFIYRIHEKPDSAKVERLNCNLKPFGVQRSIDPENPTGRQYQALLDEVGRKADRKPFIGSDGKPVEHLPVKTVVAQMSLRSMQKAKYSDEPMGHFGLGVRGDKYGTYGHFTSPIRRLCDLIEHEITKDAINGRTSSHKIGDLTEFVHTAAEQCSNTEIVAVDVERDIDNLKCAQWMNEHIGEKFAGVINGITDFGAFVYLPNTCEGLVKMENLPKQHPKEYWNYDQKNGVLKSQHRSLKMGDGIEVVCVGVNMARRQCEFSANEKVIEMSKNNQKKTKQTEDIGNV